MAGAPGKRAVGAGKTVYGIQRAENHSRRTQFLKRMVEFAHPYRVRIRLAYYPPYHSKCNPVERTFGCLENHWNGSLLESIEATLEAAR